MELDSISASSGSTGDVRTITGENIDENATIIVIMQNKLTGHKT